MVHNKLRYAHGSQPLIWSEDLGAETQQWCEELAMNDALEHDNKTLDAKDEGENLAAISGTGGRGNGRIPNLCIQAVRQWYSEEVNYDYETGLPKSPELQIVHFAQVFNLFYVYASDKWRQISTILKGNLKLIW